MSERRQLQFDSFDDVIQDITNLQNRGHARVGQWNLSQVCRHLELWMSFLMDGFPKPPLPIKVMLWMMRVTIGRRMLNDILKSGFKPGGSTMPETVPEADAESEDTSVNSLKETIERLKSYDGPIHPSPLFGSLDGDTAMRLQLAHCAHHLSFLLPQ